MSLIRQLNRFRPLILDRRDSSSFAQLRAGRRLLRAALPGSAAIRARRRRCPTQVQQASPCRCEEHCQRRYRGRDEVVAHLHLREHLDPNVGERVSFASKRAGHMRDAQNTERRSTVRVS